LLWCKTPTMRGRASKPCRVLFHFFAVSASRRSTL
jgi:hypothetical protein